MEIIHVKMIYVVCNLENDGRNLHNKAFYSYAKAVEHFHEIKSKWDVEMIIMSMYLDMEEAAML